MSDLNGKPKLTGEQAKKLLATVGEGWEIRGGDGTSKLIKEFNFSNFDEAVQFVNKVAEIAKNIDHHPDIYLHDFKKVKLELWTHQVGGLHENDFNLAQKIDKL